ncbi:uncharacterized protein LOC144446172 [Glandiceps talaboti]
MKMASVTSLLTLVVVVACVQIVTSTVNVDPSGTVIKEAGESFTLTCEATSSATKTATFTEDKTWKPQKYVRRKRNEESLSRSKRADTIQTIRETFDDAVPWDSGRWVCKSEDSDTGVSESANVDLVVVQVDKSNDVQVYESDLVGGAIWCTCVNLDPRMCEIVWRKDGDQIPPGGGAQDFDDDDVPDVFASDDTQGLVFLHNKASDSGTYTCTAQVTVAGVKKEMPARSINVKMETEKDDVPDPGVCDRISDVSTDGSTLHYYRITNPKLYSGVFTFQVQASENVIIRLKPSNNATTDFIEVILGSDGNTKSRITRYIGSYMPITVEEDTFRVLASYEVRTFTIIYAYDMVEVRTGTERTPIISLNQRHGRVFNDPAIYVRVVEYETGDGVQGSFFVCNPNTREPWYMLTSPSELKASIIVAVIACVCILIAVILALLPKWRCPGGGVPVDPEKNADESTKPEETKEPATTTTDETTKDMLPLAPTYGDPVHHAEKRHKKHKKHRKHHKKKKSWSPEHDIN